MKKTIQAFVLFSISYLHANVSLIKTDGSCLSENSTIESNIKVIDQEKLSDGVCFYHIYYYAGLTDKIASEYEIVVVDRKKPYRLRPLVDISRYSGPKTVSRKGKDDETKQVENFGAFKSHSVMTFVKSRTKNIVAAINGPVFSFSNGKKHSLLNRYQDGKKTEPNRTFLYGGLNLKNSESVEPILGMSSNYDKLDLTLFFHNMGTVKTKHDFSLEYGKVYTNRDNYIKEDANLRNVGKNSIHTSNLDWAIGIASGSFMGQVYIPKKDTKITFPKNAKHESTVYGTKEKPRYWYENVANAPTWSASEIEPIIAYNEDYVILGLNLGNKNTDEEVLNQDVYLAFNSLGMKYGAYLDGGGSSQLVIKGSNGSYVDKSNKLSLDPQYPREVFSALAVVKAYSDLQFNSPKFDSYSDDIKKKYRKAIYYLTDFGIFGGHNDGSFGAGEKVTRAEISKMIVRLLEIMQVPKEKTEYCEMTMKIYAAANQEDISHWFFTQTNALQAKDRESYAKEIVCKGILNGRNNTRYLDINGNVTYWELSKMISIAFQGTKNLKSSENGDWPTRYSTCLENYGKGYTNRFKEKYNNIFDDKLQGVKDENTKKWFSPYALREDVALFLYRAFILWQDGKFDDVSKSCVEK